MLVTVTCLALLRGEAGCCSIDSRDDGPCVYDETPLAPDDETPWGTTPAQDIAALEVPQHGTWRWGEDQYFIEIDEDGVELSGWATFVHDAATIRYSEHVSGGLGVACDGPTVSIDGTLTITDEQGAVIISVPLTVQRQYTAHLEYVSSPQYSPISLFSSSLQEQAEFDVSQVYGVIVWRPRGLIAEFYYQAQSMTTATTGDGAISLVGMFEADEQP